MAGGMWTAIVVLILGLIATGVVSLANKVNKAENARIEKDNRDSDRYGGNRYLERDLKPTFPGWPVAVLTLVIVGIILAISSYTTIPVRSIGITSSFGKPDDQLKNGLHWVAPWEKVETFDASVHTLKLDGSGPKDTTPSVPVRLGNQSTATVDVVLQWNINPDGDIKELYRQYKDPSVIEPNVIEVQLQHAMTDTFKAYDPLAALQEQASGQATSSQQGTDQLAAEARTTLQAALGANFTVDSLTVVLVHYDSTTEAKIQQYQQAIADTRIAQQQEQTNKALAAANAELASQAATQNPYVAYQNCLNLVQSLAAKGQLGNLPTAFTCEMPGNGSSTPVIVGGSSK